MDYFSFLMKYEHEKKEDWDVVHEFLLRFYKDQKINFNYKEARKKALEWRTRYLEETDEDVLFIKELSDGYKLVQLVSEKSFYREGFFMKNCLGKMIVNNDPKIIHISLRNKNNIPKATISLSHRYSTWIETRPTMKNSYVPVEQLFGKMNLPVPRKHLKYLHEGLDYLLDSSQSKPAQLNMRAIQSLSDSIQNNSGLIKLSVLDIDFLTKVFRKLPILSEKYFSLSGEYELNDLQGITDLEKSTAMQSFYFKKILAELNDHELFNCFIPNKKEFFDEIIFSNPKDVFISNNYFFMDYVDDLIKNGSTQHKINFIQIVHFFPKEFPSKPKDIIQKIIKYDKEILMNEEFLSIITSNKKFIKIIVQNNIILSREVIQNMNNNIYHHFIVHGNLGNIKIIAKYLKLEFYKKDLCLLGILGFCLNYLRYFL